jgi:hypothetical protein
MFEADVDSTCAFFHLNKDDPAQVQKILLTPVSPDLDHVLNSADAIQQMRNVVILMNAGVDELARSIQLTESAQYSTGETAQRTVTVSDTITKKIFPRIRIVSLGVKMSHFIYQALEYMLNHWRAPTKSVQFVTNGEADEFGFLNFWKSACIMQLCTSVQYVRLDEYLPFGYNKGKKCKRLYKME